MRRHLLTLSVVFAGTLIGAARQLSPAEAMSRVELQTPSMKPLAVSSKSEPKLKYTLSEDDINTLYVFSCGTDGGFLVVPADDVVDRTLLGYSDNGTFDSVNIPENLQWWLMQYSEEIAAMVNNGGESQRAGVRESSVARADIEPIVKTLWNQEAPYNDLCPVVDGVRCPTGCVATAMAQAMNVFQWPERGIGSHSYKPVDVGTTLSVDFSATTYEWDKMEDVYTSSSSEESKAAVATLMYSCGVAISMNYHPNSSGGNYITASRVLVDNFNYDKSLRCLGRDYFELDEWIDMIYAELDAGRPVLYGGTSTLGGHAFVCDGYREGDYFHINWGWGGTSNGYFLITALNPEEQGVGGSSGGFNIGQTMVIGLQPPVEGSEIIPVVEFVSDFSVQSPTYDRAAIQDVTFYDPRGIFNQSVGKVDMTFGVKLTDESGAVTYVPATESMDLLAGQAIRRYSVPAADFPQSGKYVVTPAVKSSGVWTDACVKMSNVRSLALDASASELKFSATAEPAIKVTDFTLDTPLYPGKEFKITAVLTNVGGVEYYETVEPVLLKDDEEIAQGTPIAVELMADDSKEFVWVGTFPSSLATGEYVLHLVDSSGKGMSEGIPVTVETAPTETAAVTASSMFVGATGQGLVESEPAEISLADFKAEVTLNCTAGYFAHNIKGYIYYAANQGVKTFDGTFVGIKSGQNTTVSFQEDLSDLEVGHTYIFVPWADDYGQLGNPMYFRASGTSAVDDIVSDIEVTLSPNPAYDMVCITSCSAIQVVSVYSISGAQVMRMAGDGNDSMTFTVASLPSGIYMVRVVADDNIVKTLRLLKR